MSKKTSKEIELEKRLQEAEEIISALRKKMGEGTGTGKIELSQLIQVEDQVDEQARIAADRLNEIETIYRNVPIGLCVLNRDLEFTRVNDYLARINGVSAEEHLGRSVADIVPLLAGKVEDDLRRILKTGEPILNIHLSGETPAMPGVERHWLEHWLPLFNNQGEVVGINMVVEEITGRKQVEDELKKLNATLEERVAERTKIAEDRAEKLREMALQMTRVEENERQRLSCVLHDGLQQLLIGAKLIANTISLQLAGQDEIRNQLDELNIILDQSIESSRSLSYDLSPPILNDEGLLEALHWLIKLRHMRGLDVKIHSANEMPDLSQNLMVFLFQAVRELLINVIKHAEVKQAQIILSSDDQYVCVEVVDQGKGFDVREETSENSGCQGLQNIRQKLELMNGYFKISSKPGNGSHFTIRVPYRENSDLLNAGRRKVKNPDDTPRSPKEKYSGSIPVGPEVKYTGGTPGGAEVKYTDGTPVGAEVKYTDDRPRRPEPENPDNTPGRPEAKNPDDPPRRPEAKNPDDSPGIPDEMNHDGSTGSIVDTAPIPHDGKDQIKILVVDDNDMMRSNLIRLLEREPEFYLIGEAINGAEALDFVQNEQPDVIMMDILMPEMDGVEATRRIHLEFPEIRIIGYTLRTERKYITQMKKAGVSDYINKGCSAEQLYETIRRAIK